RVPQQTETGDIGTGVNLESEHRVADIAIQREHLPNGCADVLRADNSLLESCRDNTSSDPLGENENIAGCCPGICQNPFRMNQTCDRVSELDLVLTDAMAAEDDAISLMNFVGAASENRFQILDIALSRVDHQRQRSHG